MRIRRSISRCSTSSCRKWTASKLCARIRNDPRYADLPIIMVTSLDDMNSLANAFVAGATDYVTKPVNRIELVARVRAALRLKQELDRRQARERELLAFLSSWGDRRAGIWIDEATGLFVGEAAEAYLTSACGATPTTMSFPFSRSRSTASTTIARPMVRERGTRRARAGRARGAPAGGDYRDRGGGLSERHDHRWSRRSSALNAARELAETLRATVQKLRLPNSESVASDYVTASVAAITGRVKRDVDRVQLLTQAISSVQQAAAAGGNRVLGADGRWRDAERWQSDFGKSHAKREVGATA